MADEDPFKKVREDLEKMNLPEEGEPDEIEARLQEIEDKRIPTDLPPVPEWDYERPKSKQSNIAASTGEDYRGLGYGLAIAYTMVGPLIVGWFVGMLIDKSKGTGNQYQTWLTIAGMVLGFVGAIVIMSKGNKTPK